MLAAIAETSNRAAQLARVIYEYVWPTETVISYVLLPKTEELRRRRRLAQDKLGFSTESIEPRTYLPTSRRGLR